MKHFNLITELTLADFKVRYKNSYLGLLWSVMKPLFMLGILYFVFKEVLRFDIENYVFFLLIGIVFWNYFSDATTMGMHNILQKRNLIRSVQFPIWSVIVSASLNTFITLMFNMFVIVLFLIVAHTGISWYALFALIPILSLYFMTLGASAVLATLYVRLRDIDHIWGVFLHLGFWATPIVYSQTQIPQKYLFLYAIHPLATILQGLREILIESNTHLPTQLLWLGISLIICFGGMFFFNKKSIHFAENI